MGAFLYIKYTPTPTTRATLEKKEKVLSPNLLNHPNLITKKKTTNEITTFIMRFIRQLCAAEVALDVFLHDALNSVSGNLGVIYLDCVCNVERICAFATSGQM